MAEAARQPPATKLHPDPAAARAVRERRSAREPGPSPGSGQTAAREREQVLRAREGDRDAFEALAVQAMPRLLGTATRLLGPGFAAEEAVADALFRAFRHVARFRGGAAFSTWLHRILCRVIADQYRAGGRDRRLRERLTVRALARGGGTGVEGAGAAEVAPLDRLAHEETSERLRRIAARLPPTQRLVLLLFAWEELSLLDIAGLLTLKYATVKSHLHHARTAVRRQISLGEARGEGEPRP